MEPGGRRPLGDSLLQTVLLTFADLASEPLGANDQFSSTSPDYLLQSPPPIRTCTRGSGVQSANRVAGASGCGGGCGGNDGPKSAPILSLILQATVACSQKCVTASSLPYGGSTADGFRGCNDCGNWAGFDDSGGAQPPHDILIYVADDIYTAQNQIPERLGAADRRGCFSNTADASIPALPSLPSHPTPPPKAHTKPACRGDEATRAWRELQDILHRLNARPVRIYFQRSQRYHNVKGKGM